MLLFETLLGYAFRKSVLSLSYPAVVILLLSSLIGCADENAGGPVTSNLSVPTNETSAVESDEASPSTVADIGGEDPRITMTSTSSGITANVSWDQPPGFSVTRYTIYYGKSSQDPESGEITSDESSPEELQTEELSWCSQGENKTVEAPSTTITGLQPNTSYFIAIQAFTGNESESVCSNAITMITPPGEA